MFTRIYSLNPSHSKTVIMGLVPSGPGTFVPVIRLVNQTGCGITFTEDSFAIFNVHIPRMQAYLERKKKEGDTDTRTSTIYFEGITVKMANAYGGKSLIMDQDNPDGDQTEETYDSDYEGEAQQEQPLKRRKLFTPSIVMHRITFEQLVHLLPCLEKQLTYLRSIISEVTQYKKTIVDHIDSLYAANHSVLKTRPIIHQFITAVNNDTIAKVTADPHPTLPQDYVIMLCQEILSLNIDCLVKQILKSNGSDK